MGGFETAKLTGPVVLATPRRFAERGGSFSESFNERLHA